MDISIYSSLCQSFVEDKISLCTNILFLKAGYKQSMNILVTNKFINSILIVNILLEYIIKDSVKTRIQIQTDTQLGCGGGKKRGIHETKVSNVCLILRIYFPINKKGVNLNYLTNIIPGTCLTIKKLWLVNLYRNCDITCDSDDDDDNTFGLIVSIFEKKHYVIFYIL